MLLTDTEWLRFMTFALVVGGVLGGVNVGALLLNGWPLAKALGAGITLVAVLGLVVHGITRTLLQRATGGDETPSEDTSTENTST